MQTPCLVVVCWAGLFAGMLVAQPTLQTPPAAPVGSPHPFVVRGAPAGVAYVFDISLDGTSPGTPLGAGGPVVPLNRPFVFLDTFGASSAWSSVFVDFHGVTDGSGRATPRLVVPALPELVGVTVDAACVLVDPSAPGGLGPILGPVSTTLVGGTTSLGAGALAPFPVAMPTGTATHYVAPWGSDAQDGLTPQTAWREISHAATQVGPGDIVDIMDGAYQGPVLVRNVAGTAGAPVVFRATGTQAVLTGSGNSNNDNRNSIFIGSSSHVVVYGLRIFASNRAGVRVSLSDHVTIAGCTLGNHARWGIFTDFADDLSLLGNECFGSIAEHGIYHSNSGDRAVIAGNFCHDNNLSGIQINADPQFLTPIGGYVPDGISSHCVVARNLCLNNGASGAAGINLASVRDSVIHNNVIVNDLWANSTGIAMWDDGNGPQWGCKDNVVEHNTVAYASGAGRYALSLLNGSTGNRVRNNVFQGGRRGAIAFVSDSLPGLVCDGNVLWSVDGWPIIVRDEASWLAYTLAAWQGLGFGASSLHGVPVFQAPASQDWSLASASPGRDDGLDVGVLTDHAATPRPVGAGVDRGAFDR
jgi:hypothetical protein